MGMDRFPHRCTIERSTKTNTDGEIVTSWSDHKTGVRCWVQEKKGTFTFDRSGAGLEYEAIAFFKPGTNIKPGPQDDVKDRIKMTKPARLNGDRYLVMHVADEAGTADHLVAFLRRVKESD